MNKVIVGVLDTKVHAYKFLNIYPNIVDAARDFEQAVNDDQTIVSKYPEEHELFKLGEIDQITGKVEQTFPPVFITSAKVLKRVQGKKEEAKV